MLNFFSRLKVGRGMVWCDLRVRDTHYREELAVNYTQRLMNLQVCTIVIFINRRIMRKPDFCLCENKGADQLRSDCKADQRLCFCYMDSTIPLLSKLKISRCPAIFCAQLSLCRTWSEPQIHFSNEILPFFS